MAPINSGMIIHFMLQIRCISTHKVMHFTFFSASFCMAFLSAGTATSISKHVFSLLCLIIISGIISITVIDAATDDDHDDQRTRLPT